jgi:phosphoribosylamine--glycine ligase/phosphoribosylformylglycinamidine cyclo-ligase
MSAPLRVLLVGNGGREHTLAWKLAQSSHVEVIHVVPGNGGTAGLVDFLSINFIFIYL